jgi:copper chaperone NosL
MVHASSPNRIRHNTISPQTRSRAGRTIFLLAFASLAVGLALPWWTIRMTAPQYPYGLHVTTGFFAVTGDWHEIDGLNHYIGFMPLVQMAHVERQLAFVLGPAFALALLVPVFVRGRLATLAALPAITLPAFFVADLALWLAYAGNHLDPHAALSSSVAPWTPALIGQGGVGQFITVSQFGIGFGLAVLAALLAVVGVAKRLRA